MSERIKLGVSIVRLWGKYGTEEAKRRLIGQLATKKLDQIQKLGGSLDEGQVNFINETDPLARSLSLADFKSARGLEQFVKDFPNKVSNTQSLSVLRRREKLVQQRTTEEGELMNGYRLQLIDVTIRFIKSLF